MSLKRLKTWGLIAVISFGLGRYSGILFEKNNAKDTTTVNNHTTIKNKTRIQKGGGVLGGVVKFFTFGLGSEEEEIKAEETKEAIVVEEPKEKTKKKETKKKRRKRKNRDR